MLGNSAFDIARKQCISIAQDRITHLRGEMKEKALALVALTLSRWKYEQAAPDGTVEIAPSVLAQALMATSNAGRGLLSVGDAASGVTKRRVAVSDLQPWECAGYGVSCDADLFARLLYGARSDGGYAPANEVERTIGYGVAIALLLERDGMSMPPASLASAVRCLWIFTWEQLKAYREDLQQLGAKEAEATKQRRDASAQGAAAKRLKAENVRAECRAVAQRFWRADPTLKADSVAIMVRDELRIRGYGNEDLPAQRTIRDVIKGVKNAVTANLTRADFRNNSTA